MLVTTMSGISLEDIIVSQPSNISVRAGEATNLQCSFNSSENTTIGGYKWVFINPSSTSVTEVTNNSEKFIRRIFMLNHTIFTTQQKADIEIHDVQPSDTGTYICEVELFANNTKGRGNGTWLKVLEGISLQDIAVSQSRKTSVRASEATNLQCSFNSRKNTTISGYKWFFINPSSTSETEVTNMSEKFRGRVFMLDRTIFTSQQKADIEIHNVQPSDTGTYICEVELFPNNSKGRGNGTWLKVLEASPTVVSRFAQRWKGLCIWVGVACLLLASSLLTVCVANRKRKRKRESCPDSSNAVAYEAVPEQDKKIVHGQTTPQPEECLNYATLSIEDDKRRPRPCKASEEVIYSKVRTHIKLEVSRRPSQDPDHILYTRVNSVTGANAAHHPRKKSESVIYARMSLNI
ncbi:hypothetical protein NDU88_000928 [Pleurodeles waltl]|uniref:Natural cytotoxicity triggering receptor 3 n=2 Tax=Pleurodeles waltl TaxID=8319 RepID=A0AAV7Q5J4_PLEWA|nr:hypothetical protein NDU88_000928 [Pleurodeles waltl]